MSSAFEKPPTADVGTNEKKKLILCFDGTGNTFSGSDADTNVVKILRKLDRHHPEQFHYYQTGIGTYDINETSVNKNILRGLRSELYMTIDKGLGSSFDAHDARIYIFGFSRGAFIAKFLARMIHTVGLLCKGNEEMVPFAYRLYQSYLAGEVEDRKAAHLSSTQAGSYNDDEDDSDDSRQANLMTEDSTNGPSGEPPAEPRIPELLLASKAPVPRSQTTKDALNEIQAFSQTFCRKETNRRSKTEGNIKVFFLGMWDCVASVRFLEWHAPTPVAVTGTAHHVRHAVAVDERRVKFKPALLAQDIKNAITNEHIPIDQEDIKEVWFPGKHGDVGGGWPAVEEFKPSDVSFLGRIANLWNSWRPKAASENLDDDRFQMSDIPLDWMIREVKACDELEKHEGPGVHWCDSLEEFESHMKNDETRKHATRGFMHDCLSFGYGSAFFKVLLWKLMELLPFIFRWELNDRRTDGKLQGWERRGWHPNRGSARDIPRGAVLHQSLLDRLNEYPHHYKPQNKHGYGTHNCFPTGGKVTVYDDQEDTTPERKAEKKQTATFRIHEKVVVTEKKGRKKHFIQKSYREPVRETDVRHQTYDFNDYVLSLK
ncbi:hypothetical protein ACJ41O_006563 [Fusarium nematophilum]